MNDTENDHKTKAPLTYKTVKFSVFTDAMVKLGIENPGDLSAHLGYSRTAHNPWRKSGRLPKAAALACECLLRRQNKEDTRTPVALYFLTVPRQHSFAIDSFCKSLKINIQLVSLPPEE